MPVTDGGQRLCPSCGNANPDDAHFCRECGAILIERREAAKRTIADPAPPPPPADSPPASKRTMWIAAAVAAVVLVAGFFAYQRNRAATSIPVPGTAPPAEYPTIPVPEPTAQQQAAAERPSSKPAEAPPLERERRREGAGEESSRIDERTARATAPEREEREEGRLSPRQPGWYRMRFDAPLFESPNENAPILTRLRGGTRIRVTRVLPGFLAVESTTGKRPGYVSSDDALPESVAGPVR